MKAQKVITYHISATPDEWLELAAQLPRRSQARKSCIWMANKDHQDWTTFSGREYGMIADAALAAHLSIELLSTDAE